MRRLIGGFLLAFLSGPMTMRAQNVADEKAVRDLPEAFSAAWAKHDAHALARIMAEDVDFVAVGALWLHTRSDFEKYHMRLLTGRFNAATITTLRTDVRFLRPDIASIHWSWTIKDDRNIDGTARKQRFGMMTIVAERRNGNWQIVVAQNEDADPRPAPELGKDVKPFVPIPGTNSPQIK